MTRSEPEVEAHVFDIDGTLLESFEADCELFVLAVREVLGVESVNTDWAAYPHVTDQGVLHEIMRVNGISPNPMLIRATRRKFVSFLRAHIAAHGAFREIPGALDFVTRMIASDRHFVAYATGGWRESALLKLESAGFPTRGVRLSTSSEFEDRVSIMRGAVATAPGALSRITYYGDGTWDRDAAAELGWEFVPVGAGLRGLESYHSTDAD